MSFRAPSETRVSKYLIPAWGDIPNTSVQDKPLLIYHSAFDATAAELSARLEEVGVVVPQWQYTMYKQSHFHTTAHEVLGVVSGRARVCFGGEENPDRVEPVVEKGDFIIVPAGVAHRLLEDLTGDFKMLGSYPRGKDWDLNYGAENEDADGARRTISQQPWFDQDPLYGQDGPVLHV